MNPPTITANAGIFLLLWPEDHISIHLDRIRQDKVHTTAEITVKSTLPGVPSHLHQARLNLTSTIARRDLVRVLTERAGMIDWYAAIEQTCKLVLERLRTGEPVIDMSSYSPPERLPYRVAPLIVERGTNLYFGLGGTGKTWLAQFFACLISYPMDHAGFRPEPGKVLYLDYEDSPEIFEGRLQMIGNGLDMPKPDIFYRYCSSPLIHDVEEIQRIIIEHHLNMVVIDSVGLACGGEPEKAEPVLAYYQALRSLRITSLSLDHMTKGGNQKQAYGNQYKMSQSRNAWEVVRGEASDDATLEMGLFHRKANHGMLHRPLGLTWTFIPDEMVTVHTQNPSNIVNVEDKMPLRLRISNVLSHGAMSIEAIAEELQGTAPQVVRNTLNHHPTLFIKTPTGQWGLLSHPSS